MTSHIELEAPPISYWKGVYLAFKNQPLAVFGAVILAMVILLALFAPFFSPYTYYDLDFAAKNQGPSVSHWFGTDDLGRDVFTRVWYGARISLLVGISAACIDMIVGVVWGGVAALYGGKIDEVMMRVVDVLSSIPTLLVVIPLITVIGPGLHTIILALALLGWLTMARIARAQLMQIKQQGYVLAAQVLGAGFWRILIKHMVPNATGTILVSLMMTVPTAIFAEAFLSYLGLGVQAPIASLGSMANDGLPALEYYPWRLFYPAGLISVIILSFNLIGDGLRTALRVHS